MGEEEGFYLHAGVLPPIEPESKCTIPKKKKNRRDGRVEDKVF